MALSRTSALRAVARTSTARPMLRSSGPRQLQPIARRTYADGGHHTQTKSNDLTWGLVATAVTVPGAYYLLQPGADAHHGDEHEHGKEGHEEEPAEEAEEAPKEESDGGEQTSDDGDQEGKEEQKDEPKASESEDKGDTDTSGSDGNETQDAEASDGDDGANKNEEGGEDQGNKSGPEGVRFKGSTNQGDEDNEMGHERKIVPDAKGGNKKRLNSGYAKSLSPPSDGSQDSMSSKQQGISNTETKHSVDIANDPEKSKKGEGYPETAKVVGTVRTDRPQR